MFDLADARLVGDVIEMCGLERAVFPPVVESGTVVGAVTAAAAAETGLPRGTPVVAGGADTQLGAARARRSRAGPLDGRRRHVLAAHDGARRSADRPAGAPADAVPRRPGPWMIEGIGFYCGHRMRWFRDAFCEPRRRGRARAAWTCTTSWASGRPASRPARTACFGIFSNVMHASRWVHASPAFVSSTSRPAGARRHERVLPRDRGGGAPTSSRGHRGSSRRSPGAVSTRSCSPAAPRKGALWAQILADVLGAPCGCRSSRSRRRSAPRSAPGSAQGSTARVEDADRLVRFERTVEPEPGRRRGVRGSLPANGSRPTGACSSWQAEGSCARCGARPEPDDRPEGHHARS